MDHRFLKSDNRPYYGEIQYSVGKSDKSRSVVYKIFSYTEADGQLSLFPSIYCIITNQNHGDPKSIMDFYKARSASENFTKELRQDFNAGILSDKKFIKNEMGFLISSYVYHLFHMFQWEVLEESDKTITMETYRRKYQKIAVRVVNHSRKISLHFSSAYTCIENFYRCLNKLTEIRRYVLYRSITTRSYTEYSNRTAELSYLSFLLLWKTFHSHIIGHGNRFSIVIRVS